MMELAWRLFFKVVCCGSFLVFISLPAYAQPYTQAPALDRPVWKIIEWERTNEKQKTAARAGTSIFDRQGHLTKYSFLDGRTKEEHLYSYDAKGRMTESREGSGERRVVTNYVYKKNSEVRVETFHERKHKIFIFYKDGKKVEEKFFVKGEELGTQLKLKDRIVYNYNKRDSLTGETHYAYPLRGKHAPNKRKVLYYYKAEGGKRSSVIHYDFDGNLRLRSEYLYDAAGRLSTLHHHFPDQGPERLITYKYQKGKLWQIIEETDFKKYVQIYKEGRLIRTRSYQKDQLISIVDYQYLYFGT